MKRESRRMRSMARSTAKRTARSTMTKWRYQRRNGAYWQQNGAYRRRNGGYQRRFGDIDDGLVRDYWRQLGFSV